MAGDIVTRSITGHVTVAMTEHYSHVDAREKLAAASKVLLLLAPANQLGESSGGLTNGRTEGFNNKAKLVKKRAYGYRSFRNYRLRLLNEV